MLRADTTGQGMNTKSASVWSVEVIYTRAHKKKGDGVSGQQK